MFPSTYVYVHVKSTASEKVDGECAKYIFMPTVVFDFPILEKTKCGNVFFYEMQLFNMADRLFLLREEGKFSELFDIIRKHKNFS